MYLAAVFANSPPCGNQVKALLDNATRFLQMLSEQGGLATAKQLLWDDKPSDGFTTLWERGRLDLTVEAHVITKEFAELFTEADLDRARNRLKEYGWDELAATHPADSLM